MQVQLFATCLADLFLPEVATDAEMLLRRGGVLGVEETLALAGLGSPR